ncbi:MAG: hypothetical protein HXX09_10720 [Bacteroidetes bacterium]|nr:hypothetical protein [Bacteroidota bacterium]
MSFEFDSFIEELRENENEAKRKIIDDYEQTVGPLSPVLEENKFYIDYVSKFDVLEYNVPEESYLDGFNYPLLLRLIASSLSSEYDLVFLNGCVINEKPDLNIIVLNSGQKLIRSIDSLWGFQIARLYEIYITEALLMQTLLNDEPSEDRLLENERTQRIKKHNQLVKEALAFSNPNLYSLGSSLNVGKKNRQINN